VLLEALVDIDVLPAPRAARVGHRRSPRAR
jgi:hypothetical protein